MSRGDPRIGSVWTGSVLTGSVLTGSVLTGIMRTGMVVIAMLERTDISEPTYQTDISKPAYKMYVGSSSLILHVCRKGEPSYGVFGMPMPNEERWSRIPDDGQGSRLVPPITEQSVRPQVDDVICLHLTADRSGTGEQCTGVEACLVTDRCDRDDDQG